MSAPGIAQRHSRKWHRFNKASLFAWDLEEASGNRAALYGGVSLTPNNTPGNATGKNGNAVSLVAASTQYLSASVLSGTVTEMSVSFWGNRSSTADILAVGWESAGQRCNLIVYNDGNVYSSVETSAGQYVVSSDSTTGWQHYVLVFNGALSSGNRIKQYRNSVDLASPVGGSTPPTSYTIPATFYVGFSGTPSNGLIDSVVCQPRAFTQGDVNFLYNGGSGRNCSQL